MTLSFVLGKIPIGLRRAMAWMRNRRPIGVDVPHEPGPQTAPIPEKGGDIRQKYLRIESEYIPGPYAGKVFLLWADGDLESPADAQRWWRQIAPRNELISIPGSPHTVSLTDHVQAVAKILTSCIARQ